YRRRVRFLFGLRRLVFADFGGPPKPRALAYAATIVAGDAAIVIASLLSGTVAWAVLAMFAVMFLVSFAAIYGGYAPAFVAPVALAYSFAVFIPLTAAGLGDRLLGWSVGGAVALIAAVVLWPIDRRAVLRRMLAGIIAQLSDALASLDAGDHEGALGRLAGAAGELKGLRERMATPLRPSGVASRTLGLIHLIGNVGHAADLVGEVVTVRLNVDDRPLLAEVTGALDRSVAVLRGEGAPESLLADMEPLDRARRERRKRVDAHALQTVESPAAAGEGEADAVEAMRRSFPLLALSHFVLWLQANAAAAMGAGRGVRPVPSAPELSPSMSAPDSLLARARGIAIAALDPDGVIFRNSVRAALAMALGILLAKLLPVAHGFWITLGVLLVLRSSAASTSSTALRAVAGTFAGFIVGAVVLWAAGNNPVALWVLIPFAVFIAGYTPGAISFATGQVSFTILVVVLFTLIDPLGMTTDIARLETVSIGAVTAAVVALILWPRGARAALANAVAAVYRAAADGLHAALGGSEADRPRARNRLRDAIRQADSAFAVALGEHGERIDATAWVSLLRAPAMTRALVEDLLGPLPVAPPTPCKGAQGGVARRGQAVAGEFAGVAGRLTGSAAPGPPAGGGDEVDVELRRCLAGCAPLGERQVDQALLIIAWNDWLDRLERAVHTAAPALDAVGAGNAPRAWLRRPQRRAARGS
ncbi:MAG: FUSC family protein, partial [Gammaproteobacteria bacterium]|nr:FUSC family protein [Gammaproteobacteria bacterium]